MLRAGNLRHRVRIERLDDMREVELRQEPLNLGARLVEPGQDPPLRQQHTGFDLRFVARLARARWDHGGAIVGGHLGVGGVDVRLVAVSPGHPRAQVVAHDDPGHRPQRLEAVDVDLARIDPQEISAWPGLEHAVCGRAVLAERRTHA
jgi:hypothetical protein